MKKNTGLVIGLVFAGLLVLAGVFVFAFDRTKASDSNSSSSEVAKSTTKEFDSASIADLDGKNGKKCYVAVDGKVYDMSNFSLWRNGAYRLGPWACPCWPRWFRAWPLWRTRVLATPRIGPCWCQASC